MALTAPTKPTQSSPGRAYGSSVTMAIRDGKHGHKKHLFAIKLLESVENDFFICVG